ncbi:MAG: hypothetical protein GY810_10825 [Aureispira sp.]|nr:hypothetical protein [Aureispira sp.]
MNVLKIWCILLGLLCHKKWGKAQSDFVAYHKDSMHCKQTGFNKKPLEVCFKGINQLLDKECENELKGFNGQLECKLYISLRQEKILMTRIKVHDKQALTLKQRITIKKALKKVDFTLYGKDNNQRIARVNLPYLTSWVYDIENGKFKSL